MIVHPVKVENTTPGATEWSALTALQDFMRSPRLVNITRQDAWRVRGVNIVLRSLSLTVALAYIALLECMVQIQV